MVLVHHLWLLFALHICSGIKLNHMHLSLNVMVCRFGTTAA